MKTLEQDSQYQKMTQTKIPKLILSLAIPTIISMLVTSVYNAADTYFVSRLGTSASGAIGIVFSLMAVIQAVGFTIGMGSGSTISRLLGKKQEEEAQEMASSAFFTALFLGALVSLLGQLFLDKLMYLLGATDTILPYAREYARYILFAAPVMTLSFLMNNLLRAEGKSAFAMIGIGTGGILNIALDPLFIFVFDMGIKGAAIATAVSQCISGLILFSFFFRKKTIVHFSVRKISRKLSVYKTFLGNGMPSLFRQGLASAASIMLNHVAAGYGDAAVAAMSIVSKVFMMVFSILIGFGQGYQPVAGYNYGAGKYRRVHTAYRFMLTVGTVGMTICAAVLFAFAPKLIAQFINGDKEVIEIGTTALRFQCAAMPFMALGTACNMTFQAVGRSVTATILSACRQGIFFLPMMLVLPKLFGITGMQAAQPAADLATFFVCIPIILRFLKELKEEKNQE